MDGPSNAYGDGCLCVLCRMYSIGRGYNVCAVLASLLQHNVQLFLYVHLTAQECSVTDLLTVVLYVLIRRCTIKYGPSFHHQERALFSFFSSFNSHILTHCVVAP